MKSEIISLYIGQAGVQIGTSILELFLLEHCIDPDGFSTIFDDNDDTTFESFFENVENGRFVPRTIFLDSEPNVIDEIRSGVYHNLFHPDQLLSGIMDGANNFARGSFTISTKLMDSILDRIRKSIEVCELPQGFLINHSLSGGTGSGLTSVLLQSLNEEHSKYPRVQLPVYPGQSLASAITEPYNCTFHIHSTMPVAHMALLFDNESMYDICHKNLFMQSPNFVNINRIVALINSSMTASLRFDGVINANLTNILTNVIPFPRIHFPIVSHAPIMHTSRATHFTTTTRSAIKDIFSPEFQLVKCNLNHGRFIAIMMYGRGLISPIELHESVMRLKLSNTINFVEWSPRGFKICLNNQTPTIIPDSEIAGSQMALTMICNSTSIMNCWIPLAKRFDLLFQKRAFVHWFIEEGMEEIEFIEARADLSTLNSDYQLMTQPNYQTNSDVPVCKTSSRASRKTLF